MKTAVLDTNVFVYALGPVTPDTAVAARVLKAADVVWAPGALFAECANVMRHHVRRGNLTTADAVQRLRLIPPLVANAVPVPELWERALQLSETADHSPFDTLFVALAEREDLPLVTFDRKLANEFPARCVAPAAFAAASP